MPFALGHNHSPPVLHTDNDPGAQTPLGTAQQPQRTRGDGAGGSREDPGWLSPEGITLALRGSEPSPSTP